MEIKELIQRIAQNDDQAMVELANGLLSGEVKESFFKPISLLKRAAQQGNQEAINLLLALGEELDSTSENQDEESPSKDEASEEKTILECEADGEVTEKIENSQTSENVSDADSDYYSDENLKPYEEKFLEARLLKIEGKEKEAYSALEEGVKLCNESDFNEKNLLLQDALISLAAYYIDSNEDLWFPHYSILLEKTWY